MSWFYFFAKCCFAQVILLLFFFSASFVQIVKDWVKTKLNSLLLLATKSCFSCCGSPPMQHTVITETLFMKNIRGNNPLKDFLKTAPIDQILSLFAYSFQSIFSAGMVCRWKVSSHNWSLSIMGSTREENSVSKLH